MLKYATIFVLFFLALASINQAFTTDRDEPQLVKKQYNLGSGEFESDEIDKLRLLIRELLSVRDSAAQVEFDKGREALQNKQPFEVHVKNGIKIQEEYGRKIISPLLVRLSELEAKANSRK